MPEKKKTLKPGNTEKKEKNYEAPWPPQVGHRNREQNDRKGHFRAVSVFFCLFFVALSGPGLGVGDFVFLGGVFNFSRLEAFLCSRPWNHKWSDPM